MAPLDGRRRAAGDRRRHRGALPADRGRPGQSRGSALRRPHRARAAPGSGRTGLEPYSADDNGVPDDVEQADGTDPDDPTDFADTDDDGLSDYEEGRRGSNPLSGDSDGDGVPDGVEKTDGTDPDDPADFTDTDDDGVPDHVELTDGTDPNDADSDDDGVPDGDEKTDGTDPNDPDSDDDGVTDGDEKTDGTDPNDPDSDDDGVPDGDEKTDGTDPDDPDTDDDGDPDLTDPDGTDPEVRSALVYAVATGGGSVHAFGADAERFLGGGLPDELGSGPGARRVTVPLPSGTDVVAVQTASGTDLDDAGAWILRSDGVVISLGAVEAHGSADTSAFLPDERVISLSAMPDGEGYSIFTSRGRALPFGSASDLDDLLDLPAPGDDGPAMGEILTAPVIDSTLTPDGRGAYLVAADGGVFALGEAKFHGSLGDLALNAPIVGIAPDPDGDGYWLIGADGGVFSFAADFSGSIPGLSMAPLNAAVVGGIAYGDAYLLVGADGGVFNFAGDRDFLGSLGNRPPESAVVGIASPAPAPRR